VAEGPLLRRGAHAELGRVHRRAQRALKKVWSTERLFLQKHVSGYEESVMLSAYQGELLGAVSMRKRDITPEGKTWAGDISEVPSDFMAPLRAMVKELNWTGGGELEMVRDAADQLWLLEMNPRFPAWVHGATIAGHNLPACWCRRDRRPRASLAGAGAGIHPRRPRSAGAPDYPLPPLPEPFAGAVGHSMKHPSGLTSLAKKLHKLNPRCCSRSTRRGRGRRRTAARHPGHDVDDIARSTSTRSRRPNSCSWPSTAEACSRRRGPRAPAQHQRGRGGQRLFDQDQPGQAADQARARQRLLRRGDQPDGGAGRRWRSASGPTR
jgi:diaminopimelate decarboxylase